MRGVRRAAVRASLTVRLPAFTRPGSKADPELDACDPRLLRVRLARRSCRDPRGACARPPPIRRRRRQADPPDVPDVRRAVAAPSRARTRRRLIPASGARSLQRGIVEARAEPAKRVPLEHEVVEG